LTHRGGVIDETYENRESDYVILSDDDQAHGEYGGQLERADVEMHFGGGAFDKGRKRTEIRNPYGPGANGEAGKESLGDRYRSRKEELDEMIMRKKWQKAEKAKDKEVQASKFEGMDETFKELSSLLNFRDKSQDRVDRNKARNTGTMSKEDEEMEEWDRSMKEYKFERRVKATDRTKTPEEIAKEKADSLQELEARRLKRMNGDFDEDDGDNLSDIEDEDDGKKRKKKRVAAKTAGDRAKNPDELDSDVEEPTEREAQFTADGLVYVDRDGNVHKDASAAGYDDDDDDYDGGEVVADDDEAVDIGGSDDEASVTDGDDGEEGSSSDEDEDEDEGSDAGVKPALVVGSRIKGKFNAEEQFEGGGKWYRGTVINVIKGGGGEEDVTYDVEYDDGDVEKGMKPGYVRALKKATKDGGGDDDKIPETKQQVAAKLQKRRKLARDKARSEIPYTFEVPTTLEALHTLISTYATTGTDTSLIIQRIHLSNSVRLNRTNREKMQNYYDVLLRRFIAVGDALYHRGDGGRKIARHQQLDALTIVLYDMAQDAPEVAAAVWGRRLGVFQSALAKRLRDAAELLPVGEEGEEGTVWPSPGTLLLLRAVGRIFPVTDKRHVVVTPALLLLGQILAQTPVRSVEDVVRGLFCATLMIEFTREARRVVPEAMSFVANVLTLYCEAGTGTASDGYTIPTFVLGDGDSNSPSSSSSPSSGLATIRQDAIDYCAEHCIDDDSKFRLSFDKRALQSNNMPVTLFLSTLRLVERSAAIYGKDGDTIQPSTTPTTVTPRPPLEPELFDRITRAILRLSPLDTTSPLPPAIAKPLARTATFLRTQMSIGLPRLPLTRRAGSRTPLLAVESLAPRIENPDKYTLSRDRGKPDAQAKYDKHRREYKREHKAVSRELRLDARFIERERRDVKEKKDGKARAKRNKNFAWMESEQAVVNQQVAQGGGLLKGGGIGVAYAKKASGKIGIKKGGKMS